jgi:hypothetical protein
VNVCQREAPPEYVLAALKIISVLVRPERIGNTLAKDWRRLLPALWLQKPSVTACQYAAEHNGCKTDPCGAHRSGQAPMADGN